MKDADLDYLGTDAYHQISNELYIELRNFDLIKRNEAEWRQMQIAFLKKHSYYTKASKALRDEGKQKILNSLLQSKHV